MLEIVVSPGCRGCDKAIVLAHRVKQLKPRLKVDVVDVSQVARADALRVVAVPTYLFNGEPVLLGNPSPDQLRSWLETIDPED